MTEVLMIPDWRGGNPYLDRLAEGLHNADCRVAFDHYPKGLFRFSRLLRMHATAEVLHIHWLAPMLGEFVWSRNPVKTRIKVLLFAADLLLVRLRGVRIVWTVHNLLEHETPDATIETTLRKMLFHLAHAVIVHSDGAKREVQRFLNISRPSKISVIPHGHYLDDYPLRQERLASLRAKHDLGGDTLVILFFGALRRYKGIETLIKAFCTVPRPDLRLLIAGRPHDRETRGYIESKAFQDSRIRTNLRFVEDEDVAAYFALADVVAIPFQQTLTSGSVILAMGFGKCLILPEEARVLDIPGDEGAFYYSSHSELTNFIQSIDRDTIQSKAQKTKEIVETLGWTAIGQNIAKTYIG